MFLFILCITDFVIEYKEWGVEWGGVYFILYTTNGLDVYQKSGCGCG